MYNKENAKEPLILEPEDWSKREWKFLSELFNVPADRTERIKITYTIETFILEEKEPATKS